MITDQMNELPVTGSFYFAKISGIATGRTLQLYGEGLFQGKTKTIMERDHRFFAADLSEINLSNVDTQEA